MIYIKLFTNGKIDAYADLDTLESMTGSKTYDLAVSEEDWDKAGGGVHLENGKIVLGPTRDILMEMLRQNRDAKLTDCDYLAMPDYPLTDDCRAQLISYRQALRDLPQMDGAPWDGGGAATPWPVMPQIIMAKVETAETDVDLNVDNVDIAENIENTEPVGE